MEFDPPIASRATKELVGIAHFPEEWNPEAVNQAKEELTTRKVTVEEQKKIAVQLKKKLKKINTQLAKQRREASYSFLDMFLMFLYLPRTILWDWYLKKEGYYTQHKQRLYVIGFGFLFWAVLIILSMSTLDRRAIQWQNEVNNVDIYEWEREYYSDEDFIKSRRETIEQVINSVTISEEQPPVIVLIESDTVSRKNINSLRELDPLKIRNIVFERILEPEPYERISVKLVK